jgi:hypothetical protein
LHIETENSGARGYYVDTAVGKNTAAIKKYIENQLKVDKEGDQLSIFDPKTRLRVASNDMRGWQANKMHTCVLPVILGLCPKRKNHPLCGWIFICGTKVPSLIQL